MENFAEVKNSKYECQICGSIISKSSRYGHLRTKKHQNALNGSEPEYKNSPEVRKTLRENYQAHVGRAKATMGEDEYRIKERNRKRAYRKKLKDAKLKAEKAQEEKVKEKQDEKQETDTDTGSSGFGTGSGPTEKKTSVQSKNKKPDETSRKPKKYKKDICNSTLNNFQRSLKVTNKSAAQYLSQMKSLYKKMFEKSWDCITDDWMKNTQGVINFIESKDLFKGKSISNNTKKARYEALVSYIKIKHHNETTAWTNASSQYHKVMIKYRDISEEKRGENILSEKQKISFIPYPELLKMFMSKYKTLPIENRVVCALYLLIPTRRNEAFEQMKISTNMSEKRKSNWLVLSGRKKTPIKIILNHFKTREKYGKQTIDLQSPLLTRKVDFKYPRTLLVNILTEYVNTKNLNDGHYILSPNKKFDKPYHESLFNKLITDSFQKLTGKTSIGSTLLRRIYATQLADEKLSLNMHKQVANLMGHSLTENMKYRIV